MTTYFVLLQGWEQHAVHLKLKCVIFEDFKILSPIPDQNAETFLSKVLSNKPSV